MVDLRHLHGARISSNLHIHEGTVGWPGSSESLIKTGGYFGGCMVEFSRIRSLEAMDAAWQKGIV